MNETIVKMKFGSHLYGTDHADSDLDIKGIFMPEKRDIILGRVPKSINQTTGSNDSKNGAGDLDQEFYSLNYFIKLACEGQTVALDMLHAPDSMIYETSPVWDRIVENRSKFYTKNLNSFVGYCRKQAAKYGIKGSRINSTQEVVDYLCKFPPATKLVDVWNELPSPEHVEKLSPNPLDKNNNRIYQVCGKKFLENVKVRYMIETLEKFLDEYGHRAKLAAENKNVCWKSVSHAVRACYQAKQIYEDKTIIFPLYNACFIKDIKLGKLDYITEVAPLMEELMEEVDYLVNKSILPDEVDREFWDDFLVDVFLNEKPKRRYLK